MGRGELSFSAPESLAPVFYYGYTSERPPLARGRREFIGVLMLVLLRDRQTKLYYAAHGRWTSVPAFAYDFHSVEDALLRNRQEHLANTEVVVQHSTPSSTVVLPIGKRQWYDSQRSFF